MGYGSDLSVLSVYRPPSINSTVDDWEAIFAYAGSSRLIGGDFNAHSQLWGSSNNNSTGNQLLNVCESAELVFMNDGSPTRLAAPNQQQSAPDITLCSPDIAQISHWQTTVDTLGSDHFPIIISVHLSIPKDDMIYPNCKWNIKKANWRMYHDILQTTFNSIPELSSTASKYDYFIKMVNKASEISIPILKPFKIKRRPPSPWWDQECADAVEQRTNALIVYKQNCSIENFLNCKKVFAETKRLFKQKSKTSWKLWVSRLNKNTPIKELWRQARVAKRIPKPQSNASSYEWLEEFHNKCAPTSVTQHFDPSPPLEQDNFFSRPFVLTELNWAVKNTRNTAPGFDDIRYPMLVNLPNKFLRKCLGVMKSSPVEPLRAESQEPPLYLRREMLASRFLLKLQREGAATLNKVYQLNYFDLVCKYWVKKNSPPICRAIQSTDNRVQNTSSNCQPRQPVEYFDLLFDINVVIPSYSQQPQLLQNELREVQGALPSNTSIYTDASKSTKGSGCAFYIPSLDVSRMFKLPADSTIFTAEAVAIYQALTYVDEHNISNSSILSDSQSIGPSPKDIFSIPVSSDESGSLTKVLQHLISMKLNANYPTFVCCVLGYMRGSPNGQTSISIV
ncbi:unnamed protein product [Callosobruchus maculatus]|uniref:Endonuclease/exonuclease/phosphatase domain-containing protein n=1 Tax=Callosobruchus maculatus TaxID=64391 RepID=A0A653DKL0_CALMS|nr:unnamed protein product [Callosobruchus maculatus]